MHVFLPNKHLIYRNTCNQENLGNWLSVTQIKITGRSDLLARLLGGSGMEGVGMGVGGGQLICP